MDADRAHSNQSKTNTSDTLNEQGQQQQMREPGNEEGQEEIVYVDEDGNVVEPEDVDTILFVDNEEELFKPSESQARTVMDEHDSKPMEDMSDQQGM